MNLRIQKGPADAEWESLRPYTWYVHLVPEVIVDQWWSDWGSMYLSFMTPLVPLTLQKKKKHIPPKGKIWKKKHLQECLGKGICSGQIGIIIFHQPRFPWNKGSHFPFSAAFWGKSVAWGRDLIWPDVWNIYRLICHKNWTIHSCRKIYHTNWVFGDGKIGEVESSPTKIPHVFGDTLPETNSKSPENWWLGSRILRLDLKMSGSCSWYTK